MSVYECLEPKWEHNVGSGHHNTREADKAPTSRCIPKASNQQPHSKTSFGPVHESLTAMRWYRNGDREKGKKRERKREI